MMNLNFQLRTWSIVTLIAGFICITIDPAVYGMGVLTLWIAPPLLGIGYIVLGVSILNWHSIFAGNYPCFAMKNGTKQLWTNVAGVCVALLSFFLYLTTLEPTASLWDCAEFIAAAYKLQIPHSPGNPLFLLMGRIFTMMAGSNVDKVAWWMNCMSAVFAAGTIFLVFRITAILTCRLKVDYRIVILSSLLGSAVLAVSDTFWFSAVEAETYAMSSFFTLLIFYFSLSYQSITKLEDKNRWIIFTFYLLGLSYCVHPICLLALPASALNLLPSKQWNSKNITMVLIFAFIIVLLINRIIALGIFQLAFKLDVWMVNTLNLPFYSGAIILAVIVAVAIFILYRRLPRFRVIYASFLFLVVGFSPYLMLFLRSGQNPPLDEFSPDDLSNIAYYMSRESYGTRPLLYGPYFDAAIRGIEEKERTYYTGKENYIESGNKIRYNYDAERMTLFPRMYSREASDVRLYHQWTGLRPQEQPSFRDNLSYYLKYQLGHMYFRYFMFNFSGRSGDHQGADWLRPWEMESADNPDFAVNKAWNQYYMLPLLLGILGFVFQYRKDKRGLLTILVFYLVTGVVLATYLNSPPGEPRERDYIYTISFIIFCIWIGLSLCCLSALFKRRLLFLSATLCFFCVPIIMLRQNYDDHDRSGRVIHMEYARNVLESCAPEAILFTGGDNDTFPLWYLQEVEGVRTDVRVIVLSYFNTDWYIEQLKNKHYASDPLPITLKMQHYHDNGPNDALLIADPQNDKAVNTKALISMIAEANPSLRVASGSRDFMHQSPTPVFSIPVDMSDVDHAIPGGLKNHIQDKIYLRTNDNYLHKNALIFLDLLVNNQWERPIYFNHTSANNFQFNVKPYLVQEGLVFRLLPIKNDDNSLSHNLTLMYKNMVEQSKFSSLDYQHQYYNYEDYQLRIFSVLKSELNTLARLQFHAGSTTKARQTMQRLKEIFFTNPSVVGVRDLSTINTFNLIGMRKEGRQLLTHLLLKLEEKINEVNDPDINQVYTYCKHLSKQMEQ